MDTKAVKEFIDELIRCEYHPTGGYGNLLEFRYNGISYAESSMAYEQKLQVLFNNFKIAVIDALENGTSQTKALYNELSELETRYYDVPDDGIIQSMEHDYETLQTKPLEQEIKEAKFLKEMHGEQMLFIKQGKTFLCGLLEEQFVPPQQIAVDTEIIEEDSSDNIIYEIKGLMNYLKCGKTKAQDIVSSGILKNKGIQYWSGGWRFKRKELSEYLKDNPDALRGTRYYKKNKK